MALASIMHESSRRLRLFIDSYGTYESCTITNHTLGWGTDSTLALASAMHESY